MVLPFGSVCVSFKYVFNLEYIIKNETKPIVFLKSKPKLYWQRTVFNNFFPYGIDWHTCCSCWMSISKIKLVKLWALGDMNTLEYCLKRWSSAQWSPRVPEEYKQAKADNSTTCDNLSLSRVVMTCLSFFTTKAK